jgi:hypothetical protein
MKAFRWLLPGFAIFGFFATFLLEATFEARTTRAQMVRKEEGRWVTVGASVNLIDVPKTAIVEPGRDGLAALVDVDRLEGPVLHLESIRRFAWLARIGCLVAAISTLAGFWVIDRLRLAPPPDAIET